MVGGLAGLVVGDLRRSGSGTRGARGRGRRDEHGVMTPGASTRSLRRENRKGHPSMSGTQHDRGEDRSGFRSETRDGAPEMGAPIPCHGWRGTGRKSQQEGDVNDVRCLT